VQLTSLRPAEPPGTLDPPAPPALWDPLVLRGDDASMPLLSAEPPSPELLEPVPVVTPPSAADACELVALEPAALELFPVL
jgi:hypothetical protein